MAYSTINKSSDYMNTVLYTGTGSSNAVTGVGFQPDFTWIKNRETGYSHQLYDVLRGTTKRIFSDLTTAEETDAQALNAFGSDGFTVGTNVGVNENTKGQVSWNWKANGSGSANTDGSISSTVSANTTSGFSIVTYTGTGSNQTIGHGLGVAPKVVICKQLNASQKWINYHQPIGATKFLHLNETDAASAASSVWNDTDPTSSVFSVGPAVNCNESAGTYVAYCFAEKTGYSKFGTYTGNGNADGTFVYTGFKPFFVLVKRYNGIEQWQMTDSARDKDVSPNFARLIPDANSAESTNTTWAKIEKFSNGFKLGGTDTVSNGSGDTYIYMAFGQSLVGSNDIPCTAR